MAYDLSELSKEEREKILRQAKRDFKLAWDAEDKQRKREIAALKFQVGEFQWSDEARKARSGSLGSGGSIPPRPMISVPKLDQPNQLLDNQFRSAHLGIKVSPRNEKASKETAEVYQDLIRRIEQDSGAEHVRYWAFDRAKQCGSGAYRITTELDEDTDNPFDQKLAIRRIYDQSLVLFDPAAEMADRSDGRFAFVISWVPLDVFEDEFEHAEIEYTEELFADTLVKEPLWAQLKEETRGLMVVEYFRKEDYKRRKVVTFDDRTYGYDDEVPEGRSVDPKGRSRSISEKKVCWYKLNAVEILECGEWAGKKYIPLIPTIGKELQPFDGERRRRGLTEPAMDACQGYNYAISKATEVVAIEPLAPVIGYTGQFEGHEEKWGQVNTVNWPYLEVNPVTADGKVVPLPQRMQAETGRLGMALQLAQQYDQDIQASTGFPDPSLGRLNQKERSGIAIERLQSQADASTSGPIQNMAQVSMPLEAKILLDAAPVVYDTPERVIQVIDAQDRPRPIMLGAPFVLDQSTGMPMAVKEGTRGAKHYDLSKGTYSVSVSIGKSHATRMQQGGEQIGQLLQADPSLMMVFGDIWAQFLDIPGAQEIADRVLKLIEEAHPGLTQKDDASPEQLRAQRDALQGKSKQLEGLLAQATRALETKMAEQQATLKKADMDNATRQAMTEQNNATKIALENLKLQGQVLLKLLEQRGEARQQRHETGMARAQAGMQASEAEAGREHESGEAATDRDYQAAEAEQGRSFQEAQANIDRRSASDEAERARAHEATLAEQQMQAQQPEDPAGV